ncbi:M48 family metallopeptidase [Geodermatophilus sp. URMC 65]
MSIANAAHLEVGDLAVEVVYKDIKNLHISVYPPLGRVRVAAPDRMDEDAIRRAVVERLPWIRRQRKELLAADRETKREMLSGESHFVWGQRYLLDVSRTSGHHRVEMSGSTLWVVASAGAAPEERLGVLDRWYRRELRAALPALFEKWARVIGVEAPSVVVRRMKTKWGTCIARSGTIWLNPELAKKHPRFLEYVVVHELVHFHERTHNERFVDLMDKHLPDWRSRRDELNESTLAYEDWN